MALDQDVLRSDYAHLLTLWTSGVRDYHTMLSDYLTANSIFVAVIGLLVSRESLALPFTLIIVLFSIPRPRPAFCRSVGHARDSPC